MGVLKPLAGHHHMVGASEMALNSTESPVHMLALAETERLGSGAMFKAMVAVSAHPLTLVPSTVSVVALVALAITLAPWV